MALAIASCDKDNTGANDVSDIAPDGYVDLGLPSGTKWKTTNETRPNDTCDFYTYDEAVAKFCDNLPTIEQFLEIGNECRWTFTDSGYVAVGKNGNFIVLPAAGNRKCNGMVNNVGTEGCYWSSMPSGSAYAWYIYFNSEGTHRSDALRCVGQSVRLVRN